MKSGPDRAALCLLLAGCAAGRTPPPPAWVELPPEEVEARRADLDLAGKNEQELLAIARAASQAGDHRRAASAFGRAADLFPTSPRRAAAQLGAGLELEELGEWREALGRLLPLAGGGPGPEAERAALEAAACHHRLGELAEARGLLDGLASRGDRPASLRLRALVERGVVELEMGDGGAAERSLEVALATWSQAAAEERPDEALAAKAHYWLGEIWRERFEAAPLDLAAGEDEIGRELEEKSRLLLAAQGHYFQAARPGSPDFGVAGVTRVGELYESLYVRMSTAPAPPGLPEHEAAAWRAELERQLRVLAEKALEAYDAALTAARARGVDERISEAAGRAMERVKRLLLAGEAGPARPR